MSRASLVISGGRVIDPANGIDAERPVYIAGGRIVSVGEKPDGFRPEREIHVPGQIICPGFIDLCARTREPGHEHKATIETETRAAARAGITTLCCPPDTNPPIDTPAVAELIKEQSELAGSTRILPIGALTVGLEGQQLSELSALKEAGCVAVSNGFQAVANTLVLRRAMEYAASFDILLLIRPQDPWLSNGGCVHEGEVGTRLGLPGIPASAETVAVAQCLELIEQTGVRAHFGQLSCARSVTMVSRARYRGVNVSADVSAHQLHLTEEAVGCFDALLHLNPPLRTGADRDGLREGVAQGVIGAICSDHQPHEESAKLDTFTATEPGISSLETLLPLTLQLVNEDILSMTTAIAALTSGPAAILGLESGNLGPGAPADLCIFDPQRSWRIDGGNWHSLGLNTPYWDRTMKGQVSYTLRAGKTVFDATDTLC